jgi:hypothetical protein
MSPEALEKMKQQSWQHQLQLQHRNRYTNYQCVLHFFITIAILIGGAITFNMIEANAEKDNAIKANKQLVLVQEYLDKAHVEWIKYQVDAGAFVSRTPTLGKFEVQPCNSGADSTKLSDGTQMCPTNAAKQWQVGVLPTYLKNQLEGLISGDISGSDKRAMNWEITSSIFFVMTIISTIGYGTFAPSTDGGKAFTAIFCFVGIGYFGYTLTLVSDRALIYVQKTAKRYATRDMNDEEQHYWFLKKSHQLAILTTVCVMYVFFLSAFGPLMMGWTFLESVYFAVVTFSTVGFGDYAPYFNPERPGWFRAVGYFAFAILTITGLAILSALLGGYSEYMEELDFRAKRKAKAKQRKMEAMAKGALARQGKALAGVAGAGGTLIRKMSVKSPKKNAVVPV